MHVYNLLNYVYIIYILYIIYVYWSRMNFGPPSLKRLFAPGKIALVEIVIIWVRSRNCGCLVTWFCYQLISKPGIKTAAVSWPDPYDIQYPMKYLTARHRKSRRSEFFSAFKSLWIWQASSQYYIACEMSKGSEYLKTHSRRLALSHMSLCEMRFVLTSIILSNEEGPLQTRGTKNYSVSCK